MAQEGQPRAEVGAPGQLPRRARRRLTPAAAPLYFFRHVTGVYPAGCSPSGTRLPERIHRTAPGSVRLRLASSAAPALGLRRHEVPRLGTSLWRPRLLVGSESTSSVLEEKQHPGPWSMSASRTTAAAKSVVVCRTIRRSAAWSRAQRGPGQLQRPSSAAAGEYFGHRVQRVLDALVHAPASR